MKINILTLFPAVLSGYLNQSILARALSNNIITINVYNIRNATSDKHHVTDDTSYGGGPGMVLKPEPIFNTLKQIDPAGKILLMSPAGEKLTQNKAKDLSTEPIITIICGRYEGIDERINDLIHPEEISIGDYVLTGGELPAMVVIDSVSRYIPGVIKESQSVEEDSFSSGLLDWPHYTKPDIFENIPVPKVLLSGDHEQIRVWRRKHAVEKTLLSRPDILARADLSEEDGILLEKIISEKI